MFTAALLMMAKNWKQSNCLPTGEQTNRGVYTLEYYIPVKKQTIVTCKSMDESHRHDDEPDTRKHIT